jgi:hypothetical protein
MGRRGWNLDEPTAAVAGEVSVGDHRLHLFADCRRPQVTVGFEAGRTAGAKLNGSKLIDGLGGEVSREDHRLRLFGDCRRPQAPGTVRRSADASSA